MFKMAFLLAAGSLKYLTTSITLSGCPSLCVRTSIVGIVSSSCTNLASRVLNSSSVCTGYDMCRVLNTSDLDREPMRWTHILSSPVVANTFSSSSEVATSTNPRHPSAEAESASSTGHVLSSLFLCDASLAP